MNNKQFFQKNILETFMDFLHEKNLALNSMKAYNVDLLQFFTYLKDPNEQVLIHYVKHLVDSNLSPSSIDRKVRAISQYIKFINEEYKLNLKIEIPKIKKFRKQITIVGNREIQDAIEQLKQNSDKFLNIRLIAIINMLYSTGLRISELVSLRKTQLDPVLLGKTTGFRVIGKGSKERKVFMNKDAIQSLHAYILARGNTDSEFLWNCKTKHLTRQSIFLALKKVNINPHSFRHKLASDLLQKGMNLLEVQKIMGHASVKTTSLYLHAQNSALEIKEYHPFNQIDSKKDCDNE
ncbi:MAG: tyrosine-type recombinase/integrase [Alphaproteobacteria bacterium]|nr:MAG: tyrosine-type recombinase/integrase [Alphaproteobacteria bacterium]